MSWRLKPLDQVLAAPHTGQLKTSLGVVQLTMIGVGSTIGTGIFVLTAEAAQKAGPGMMLSFVAAGLVCAIASLCYAEMAAMMPRPGSAYTYSYAFLGEYVAWLVGWALILEYHARRQRGGGRLVGLCGRDHAKPWASSPTAGAFYRGQWQAAGSTCRRCWSRWR